MNSPWRCYCGRLSRLKFRGMRCIICRTECLIREPSQTLREDEMAEWLSLDYRDIGLKNAIRLTLHTRSLVDTMRGMRPDAHA